MTKCTYCDEPATSVLYGSPVCDAIRGDICFICSERKQQIVFTDACSSHEIGIPFKGNRFMEDKAFMGGGPFEFEPE